MKQVIFPNSKSLQPIPSQEVKPNISGNTNSTTGIPVQQYSETTTKAETQPTPAPSKDTISNMFIYIFVILVVIFVAIFVYKKAH